MILRLCLLALLWTLPAGALELRYASLSGSDDPHLAYMKSLLELACAKQKESCLLRAAPEMNQDRAMEQLQRADGQVDLFWGMTSREREARLLPVRVPLYKGLIGWRVPLVRAQRPELMREVATRPQLARLVAGQGQDWPDTAILRAAGLPVVTNGRYLSLFAMLREGRFDYFPRSVIEVEQELRQPQAHALALDPYLVIHYPAAFYFFVSPHKPPLAKTLRLGLEAAVRDGSFEQLFQRFNHSHIQALHLSERRVIELPNPLLPGDTPLERRELWFRP